MAQLISKEVLQGILNLIAQDIATKADEGHVHTIANVTGLQDILDDKLESGDIANLATQAEVEALQTAIGNIVQFKIEVVDALPTENISDSTIYLVPKANAQTQNAKDEFMYINGAWEKIGDTEIDLSSYAKTADVNTALDDKVDKVDGMGLSSNDFTTAEKEKLAGLSNYDDSEIKGDISDLQDEVNYHIEVLFDTQENGETTLGIISKTNKMYDELLPIVNPSYFIQWKNTIGYNTISEAVLGINSTLGNAVTNIGDLRTTVYGQNGSGGLKTQVQTNTNDIADLETDVTNLTNDKVNNSDIITDTSVATTMWNNALASVNA